MGLGHTVKFPQMALRLVPEVLNAIDMVFTIRKELGVIDSQMTKAGYIQHCNWAANRCKRWSQAQAALLDGVTTWSPWHRR